MTSFARLVVSRSPRSHYDVILIMTSFATELAIMVTTFIVTMLATPSVTDERTYGHLTAFNI